METGWLLAWLTAVEMIGLSVLPAAAVVMRSLSDRGFIFAKPLGILAVAYLVWLLGSAGLLRYQQATILAVLLALGVGSWIVWGDEAVALLRAVRVPVLAAEMVFLAGFVAAAWVRAHNPEISGTEKPMDFALLNALYRTDRFPAEDPWMSGLGISYYYFGYLLVATVAKLSGVPASVGYNLGVALVFALVTTGSFSLAYNVLSRLLPGWGTARIAVASLAAPLLVAIMGNLEGALEVLAVRGMGGPSFWQWVGVKGLEAASQPQGWVPTASWWWWRASRVIPTIKPDGIDEFPFFSFLLGDLHPHFVALPWDLLVVTLCLSVLVAGRLEGPAWPKAGAGSAVDADAPWLQPPLPGGWLGLAVPALALGFLLAGNSWDFPTYTALFWVCSLATVVPGDGVRRRLRGRASRLLQTSILSIALFAPFFPGFSSQTRGIGLSADKTPLPSMMILFGPFLFVVACLTLWQLWCAEGREGRARIQPLAVSGVGTALILSSAVTGATGLLLGLLLLAGALLMRLLSSARAESKVDLAPRIFLASLAFLGLILVLGPEYLFVVDLFGTRMNTVFKLHYQAWVLMGLVSSVGLVWMMAAMRPRPMAALVAALALLLVGAGLVYPVLATPAKIQGSQSPPTLDGVAFYQRARPDDYAAIQWLSRTAQGRPVVVEASGGEYSEYARVSTFSGLPTVLGWAGHEVQWRGRGEEPQRRAQDLDAIFSTANAPDLVSLLQKYKVRYVFVGTLEVEKYGAAVHSRFEGQLPVVYRQGRVTIYAVPSEG